MYKKSSSKLKDPDSVEHGFNYALFLLGLRLRTEGEIQEKMRARGYTQTVVKKVLGQLKENTYVDDARFAEILIDNYKRFKTYGFYMIKKKMIEKRLSPLLISESLNTHLPVADELEVAKKYMGKEGLQLVEGLDYQGRQKIAYKLNSRGFRSEVITKVFSGEVPEVD